MLESYNKKRVKFQNKSKQRKFFAIIQKTIGIESIKKVTKNAGLGFRQLSYWRTGENTLPLAIFNKLLKLSKISKPTNIKIIDRYSHVKSAGKKGGRVVFKKYGMMLLDEKYRKAKWFEWWNNIGKYEKRIYFEQKLIKTPRKNKQLAELFGIMIGDGSITRRQVRITLNCETDKEYSYFVEKLFRKLFGVIPKIYKKKNSKAHDICISRTKLVSYLVENGLKLGNKLKQNLSIPNWIIENKEFMTSCIKGMVDTDGSIVREIHTIKNKKYIYYRLNFTSASPTLVQQVIKFFENMNFHPKLRAGGRSVQLENMNEICDYFNVVGTHNPKHLSRIGRSRIVGLVRPS